MARKQKAVVLNVVEGGDVLIGTAEADKFVLREGDGDVMVEGFGAGDKLLFDFSSYSDVLGFGQMYDGREFYDFTGGTHFLVSAVDANSDGAVDTIISANEDSITLLGVAPDSLASGAFMGG
jgi:hypothetical protein